MNENNENKIDDVIERSLKINVPPNVEAQLRLHLGGLRQHMESSDSIRRPWWTSRALPLSGKVTLCVGSAAALLLGGLITWFLVGGGNSPLVFADVQKKVHTFKPYSCTTTVQYEGKTAYSRAVMRLSLARRRELWSNGSIRVFDLSREPISILTLDPKRKLAVEKVLLQTKPASDPDWLRILTQLQDGSETDLGTRKIDGRQARGFKVLTESTNWTIWADSKTGLPVRIELVQKKLKREIVLEKFDFNVDFDKSLFSTTAPKGYTVQKVERPMISMTDSQNRKTVFTPYSCTFTIQYNGKDPVSYRLMRWSLSRRRERRSDDRILVFDLSQETIRILELNPKKKRAVQTRRPGKGPAKDPDILKIALELQAGKKIDLGSREVEGREARGFRARQGSDYTVWLNTGSKRPLRIEAIQEGSGRRLTWSEFDFDTRLDESLFRTSAPEGYTVEKVEKK